MGEGLWFLLSYWWRVRKRVSWWATWAFISLCLESWQIPVFEPLKSNFAYQMFLECYLFNPIWTLDQTTKITKVCSHFFRFWWISTHFLTPLSQVSFPPSMCITGSQNSFLPVQDLLWCISMKETTNAAIQILCLGLALFSILTRYLELMIWKFGLVNHKQFLWTKLKTRQFLQD